LLGEIITKPMRPTAPVVITDTLPLLPTAAELQTPRADSETIVTDGRAALTPSEQIDRRLTGLLGVSPMALAQPRGRLRPAHR
jgi:hypothetical protein